MATSDKYNNLPDVRDGLNKKERIVLYCLMHAQAELNNRNVPTILLYGRVVEHIDMSEEEFQEILSRLIGQGLPAGQGLDPTTMP